jgi:hypothetical protein
MEISLSDNQLKQLIETTIFMACQFSPKALPTPTAENSQITSGNEELYEYVDLFIWPFEQ